MQQFTFITGISTQGRQDYHESVTSYTISLSDDEVNFQGFKTGSVLKVSNG